MSTNLYHHEEKYRGGAVMRMLEKKHITLCGVGAVGSNLGNDLARQGIKNFRLIDFDRVERHNINNQVYTLMDVGQLKVNAMRDILYSVNESQFNKTDCISKKLDKTNVRKLLGGTDLVIDSFDNFESRSILRNYCLDSNVQCLHVGIGTSSAQAIWNDFYAIPEVETPDEVDACDVPLARNVVSIICGVAAELIMRFFTEGEKRSVSFTLGDFRVNYL